jgi:PAS domain S-box-containing protein
MTEITNTGSSGKARSQPDTYDRFEELVNLLPQAVIEIQLDGTILFSNWHSRKLLGYGIDQELSGQENAFDHVHPSDHEVIKKRIVNMLAGEKVRPPEITAVRKDGATFPAIVYANLIMTDGKPSGARVVIADITEKKEVEEAYKTLVDHSLQALIIVQDGRPVFVNDYFVHGSGFTREEILSFGRGDLWKMVHPEDREALIKVYHDLPEGRCRQASRIEYRVFVKGRNGPELRWVINFGARIDYGGRPAVQTALVDITEKKLAEIALKESEQRYRDLAELLPQGIFETDSEGILTYANRSTLDMFRLTPDDIRKGFTIADTVAVNERQRAEKTFARVLSGEKLRSGEYSCVRKDGSVFPALVMSNVIMKGGAFMGIRGVVADITVQKKMTAQLEESEARYRTLFNSTGTAMMLIEEDMTISLANEEFSRVSGYAREWELKFPALVYEEDRIFMMEYHQKRRIDVKSVPKSYEFRFVRCDGDVRNAYLTIAMIPGTKRSVASVVDITVIKQIQRELQEKSMNLEDANAALRVLLKQREGDRTELERNVLANLNEVMFPLLDSLKAQTLTPSQANILSVVEEKMKEVTSPFLRSISSKYAKLTPREIEILVFVKDGRSTKDIARILHTSPRTIDYQRNSIRKKLGISNSKVNLRTFIMTHQDPLT